ncbi:MAG: biotin/lipoyl-binding carrier protein [Sciscionella sp.]
MAVEVRAELASNVGAVLIVPGDQVKKCQTLIIVESMKMEIPVTAEVSGTVIEVRVEERDPVNEGDIVAVIN